MDEVKNDVVANAAVAPTPEVAQPKATDTVVENKQVVPSTPEAKPEAQSPDVTAYKPDPNKSLQERLDELDKLRGKWANEIGDLRKQSIEKDKMIADLKSTKKADLPVKMAMAFPAMTKEEIEAQLADDPAKCLQDIMAKTIEMAEKKATEKWYNLETERKMDEALVMQYPDVAKEGSPLSKKTVDVLAEYKLPTELTILAARTAAAELKIQELNAQLGKAKGEAYQTITTKTVDNPVNAPTSLSAGAPGLTAEEIAFCKSTGLDQKRFAELKASESK